MSHTQRASIVFLIMTVVGVWGLGLRAALRTPAQANTSATGEAAAEITYTLSISPTVTPSPSLTPASPAPAARAPEGPRGMPTPKLPTPSPSPNPPALALHTQPPTARAEPPREVSSPSPTHSAPASPDSPSNSPQAERFLLINQDEQTMYVYEEGVQIRAIPISSGRPVLNAYTPAWRGVVGDYLGGGRFLNTDEWSDYMWYLFPGAQGSILIHSVPYLWAGDTKLYDRPDALGVEPVSHGCIRIAPEEAEWLEKWNPVGVPYEITPWSGEIGPADDSL